MSPSLSLSSTHWTPLAENLGSEEDKKGRKTFPCAYSWNCAQLWLLPTPSSETLDLGLILPPNPGHAHLPPAMLYLELL